MKTGQDHLFCSPYHSLCWMYPWSFFVIPSLALAVILLTLWIIVASFFEKKANSAELSESITLSTCFVFPVYLHGLLILYTGQTDSLFYMLHKYSRLWLLVYVFVIPVFIKQCFGKHWKGFLFYSVWVAVNLLHLHEIDVKTQ